MEAAINFPKTICYCYISISYFLLLALVRGTQFAYFGIINLYFWPKKRRKEWFNMLKISGWFTVSSRSNNNNYKFLLKW